MYLEPLFQLVEFVVLVSVLESALVLVSVLEKDLGLD
jgi:hypothetical protein